MARAQKQKAERLATASFESSQALYDVLLEATQTLAGQQKANLMNAREIVQNIDVDNCNPNSLHDKLRHEAYVDKIVRAFRISSKIYFGLFNELAKIAAPVDGQAPGRGYEDFKAITEVVRTAQLLSAQFALGEEERSGVKAPLPEGFEDPAANDDSSDASSRSGDDAEPKPAQPKATPTTTQLASRKRPMEDESAATPATISKPVHKAHKRVKVEGSEASAVKSESPLAALETAIKFEDLSEEVEARLKAKEEKKKAEKEAKKLEKKRKRESVGSDLKTEEAVEELEDDSPAVEKPKKKKSKKAEPDAEEGAEQPTQTKKKEKKDKKEKRKAATETEEPTEKRSPKKRQKI